MTDIKLVCAPDLGPPNGHYSPAVAHAGLVFVSGQLGRGPGMSDAEAGDLAHQTRRCLTNIAAILRAAGSSLTRTLRMTLYIADMARWADVDAVYREVLGEHRPARAIVAVGPLHFGALIEIDAIAARDDGH